MYFHSKSVGDFLIQNKIVEDLYMDLSMSPFLPRPPLTLGKNRGKVLLILTTLNDNAMRSTWFKKTFMHTYDHIDFIFAYKKLLETESHIYKRKNVHLINCNKCSELDILKAYFSRKQGKSKWYSKVNRDYSCVFFVDSSQYFSLENGGTIDDMAYILSKYNADIVVPCVRDGHFEDPLSCVEDKPAPSNIKANICQLETVHAKAFASTFYGIDTSLLWQIGLYELANHDNSIRSSIDVFTSIALKTARRVAIFQKINIMMQKNG